MGLHIPASFMEFFDASPTIAPKREVSDSLKERRKKKKQKRKGGHIDPQGVYRFNRICQSYAIYP